MKSNFPLEWRTQSPWKRRFYSRYMVWLERIGYLVVVTVLAAFVFAFTYQVDESIIGDKSIIEPKVVLINSDQPFVPMSVRFGPGYVFKKGEAVMEGYLGDASIAAFKRWRRAQDMVEATDGDPEVARLAARFPEPKRSLVYAPIEGELMIDEATIGASIEPGEPIGRMVDFRELWITASLSGQSVARAVVGQRAKVGTIVFEPVGGTVVRANASGSNLVSGRLLGAKLQEWFNQKLANRGLNVRDDIPFLVSEVSEVAVDARFRSGDEVAANTVSVEPGAEVVLYAEVMEGEHRATLQFAQLPDDVRSEAIEKLKSEMNGKSLKDSNGRSIDLQSLDSAEFILKVKAKPGSDGGKGIKASSVGRTFEAKLRVIDPPAYIADAVRAAYTDGRKATAKVELSTGKKPIVSTLLKKS